MNGADIGISYSSNPGRLIQQSQSVLSDNIRQIGQQVQGTILELNTRKDLGRMVQDLQGLNIQSNEFPIQAAQIYASHPLAAQDPRGQLALGALGKAHHDWKTSQDLTTRFAQQQEMERLRNKNAAARSIASDARRGNEIVNIGGTGVRRGLGPDGKPIVVVEPAPNYKHSPQGVYDSRTGLTPDGFELPAAPDKPTGPTAHQAAMERNAKITQARSAIGTQLSSLDREIDDGEKNYKAIEKLESEQEAKRNKASDKILGFIGKNDKLGPEAERSKYQTQKTIVGSIVDQKKKQRDALREKLNNLVEEMLPDPNEPDVLPPVPANAVSPTDAITPRKLDPAMAAQFLKQANGDREKARQMAKEQGFTF